MPVTADDVERLRAALAAAEGGNVSFSATLPRATAEKVLTLLSEERKAGALVVRARDEFRTSEAAAILGVSRPYLSRLIRDGRIDARQVGTHWRIPAAAIATFQEREAASRVARVDEVMEFQNAAGLND